MPATAIDCAHYEKISYIEGIETGECLYCGQVKQYVDGKAKITRPGDPAKARPMQKAEVPAAAEQMPAEEQTVAETVPPRPQKRKNLRAYFEKHKEAILADYHSMTLLKLFKKWGIASKTWTRLREDWGVTTKGRGGVHLAKSFRDKRVKPPSKEEAKKAKKAARESERGTAVEILELLKQRADARVALPDFPPFDKSWSFIVQEAWLNAYCRIAELNQRVAIKLPGGDR